MANPRHTHTNAADSAPGVDDGRATGRGPSVNTKPAGRIAVLFVVIAALVMLVAAFFTREESPDTPRLDSESSAAPASSSNADANPAAAP
jgi:hypothetical protein